MQIPIGTTSISRASPKAKAIGATIRAVRQAQQMLHPYIGLCKTAKEIATHPMGGPRTSTKGQRMRTRRKVRNRLKYSQDFPRNPKYGLTLEN